MIELDEHSLEERRLYIVTDKNDLIPDCYFPVDDKTSDLYSFAYNALALSSGLYVDLTKHRGFKSVKEFIDYAKNI